MNPEHPLTKEELVAASESFMSAVERYKAAVCEAEVDDPAELLRLLLNILDEQKACNDVFQTWTKGELKELTRMWKRRFRRRQIISRQGDRV
jgi:hypothetical protein